MNRVLQATVELHGARLALTRAEREANREKKPLPAPMRMRFADRIRLCEANLVSAEAARDAMNRFPPIGRSA